jgi:acetoacetyl-CoA synthetase
MDPQVVSEGLVLWEASEEIKEGTVISEYMEWLKDSKGLGSGDYQSLWEWSVTDIENFWESLWDFFQIKASSPYSAVLSERIMPGALWFSGSKLNYAEHVFRNISSDRPALKFQSEAQPLTEISWDELYKSVSSVAASLRKMGIRPGDRVVAFMPNIPQTTIAFLACASIGAVWSSCSPDFGTRSVCDRFQQIEPKVLFAVDGYQYGGKVFDCRPVIATLQQQLPSLERTVLIPSVRTDATTEGLEGILPWDKMLNEDGELEFEQVDFDHPIWVVYSSGTTGLPKPIVHGHGGVIIEFMKLQGLHLDVKPGDVFFWFSTTGWIMWNVVQGSLLRGATAVLYDGNPGYPDMDVLWDLAEKAKATVFGTSAAFIMSCMNERMEPGVAHDLSALKTVGSTGSPLSPAGFKWVYDSVDNNVHLASISGGTDPCTAFLGSCPLLPVRTGELQCKCLGIKAESLDDNGVSLVGEVGELVISEPVPSMPLYFWNDRDNKRYNESYFEMYPGKWRHGDWVKFNEDGSGVILGRSDSTLNRLGVRMGSSEIYSVVEEIPEIADSLVVGYEASPGKYVMPLFVVLNEGGVLNEELRTKIKKQIRTFLSPRHVPDEIHSIPEIPKTLNAKKLEVPVKKILMGAPVEEAVNVDSMSNPDSIRYFVDMAAQR